MQIYAKQVGSAICTTEETKAQTSGGSYVQEISAALSFPAEFSPLSEPQSSWRREGQRSSAEHAAPTGPHPHPHPTSPPACHCPPAAECLFLLTSKTVTQTGM